MSKRTIAKFFIFVILIVAPGLGSAACSVLSSKEPGGPNPAVSSPRYEEPKVIGTIKSQEITESSGLVASKCQAGVYWTHNDSGDGPFVFAINTAGGTLGVWRVQNAENEDWEDIAEYKDALGSCFIYIGEIGDSKFKRPNEHIIYRVREPVVANSGAPTNEDHAIMTEPAESIIFKYPDRNHNAETLMVHPRTGDIYVLTKVTTGPSGVYKIRPDFGSATLVTAQKIAAISVPSVPNGLLTGGDIAPDASHVVICDYAGAYEMTLPAEARAFDDIWKQSPERINIGKLEQGEAVCYSADGSSILATSEGKHAPIVEVKRRQ
jgi:hypothetical protein